MSIRHGLILIVPVLFLAIFAGHTEANTVVIDLRFDGQTGSDAKIQASIPGRTYVIDVWAIVTGSNNASDEGFESLIGSVQSAQINGGAMQGGTGVGVTGTSVSTANANAVLWTNAPIQGSPGTPQIVTNDQIQDWGTGTSLSTSTEIKFSSLLGGGSSPVTGSTSGAIFHAIPNGNEFLVGSITFVAGSANNPFLNGQATALNWFSSPNANLPGAGVTIPSSLAYFDNNLAPGSQALIDIQSTFASNASTPNNGVLFVPAPVPAGLAGGTLLIGLLAVCKAVSAGLLKLHAKHN